MVGCLPSDVFVYDVITECCVIVGRVMFYVCGVHGSDKLCLKLAVCLREIYDFCRLLKWVGDRECKLFFPRVMSVDVHGC